ncbi:hypothetical protein PMPD1_1865 [Paramixta manurensis]|uniref:Bacteriocin n=1 Tax=Paramixta manurensis TaxID=2740817 RepID=A0A6M8U853_9GAMM|nr:hypothetical protein PMPD1_1865 [Erwiniaceae bacterium PD-1]
MKLINFSERNLISGSGAEYYGMAVSLDIANAMAKKFGQCNLSDLTKDMAASAITGGLVGAFSGGTVVPVIGSIPGWLAGAASGAGLAAFTYGASCWW